MYVLSTVLAVILSAPQPGAIDWDSLRLPQAVKVTAIGYNNGKFEEPYDKIIAEVGPEWVRSEQHLWQGSFGYRMFDFTYDTIGESLIFNFDSRRGRRWDSFRRTGISRVERLVTPLGFVRVARRVQSLGGTIAHTTEGDNDVYSYEAPASGLPAVEIVVDRPSREIREVRLPTKRNPARVTYDEWRQLADGTRHPSRIRFTVEENGALVLDREERIESLELLDAHAGPSSYSLPEQAEIVDEAKGVVVDGRGVTIGTLPESPASGGAGSPLRQLNWNMISVAGGTGLILCAGVAWQRRRARSGRVA
jgi:hypothetical protein